MYFFCQIQFYRKILGCLSLQLGDRCTRHAARTMLLLLQLDAVNPMIRAQ